MRWRLPKYYRGWWVSGGGGGGGGGTTITSGAGAFGAATSQTGAVLTGAITGWPLNFFQWGVPAGPLGTTTDRTLYFGFFLPCQVKFNHIQFGVVIADAVNLYDVGIYNAAGTLLADIGPQTLPATGFPLNFAIVQSAVTLNPGLYAIAYTGNSNGVTFYGASQQWAWSSSLGTSPTTGGQLNTSITAPTLPTTDNHSMAFGLYFV